MFSAQEPLFPDTNSSDLLAEVQPVLTEATQFINSDLGKQGIIEELRGTMRGMGYTPRSAAAAAAGAHDLLGSANNLLEATASLAITKADTDDEVGAFTAELWSTHLTEAYGVDALAFSSMIPAVVSIARAMRHMHGFSEAVVTPLQQSLITNEQQYALMKLLAKRQFDQNDPSLDPEIQSLQILHTFSAVSEQKSALTTVTGAALTEGGLDESLAEEVFADREPEAGDIDARTRREIQMLVKLTAYTMGEVELPVAVHKLTTAESLSALPELYKKAIALRRQRYQQDLLANYTLYIEFLDGHQCIPKRQTEDDVSQAAGNFVEGAARFKAESFLLPMHKRLAARAQADRLKARREAKATKAAPDADKVAGQEVDIEQTREAAEPCRSIFYVQPDGSLAAENTAEFDKFFRDYAAKHTGQALENDLENVKTYLKGLDLSQGGLSGIKVMRTGKHRKNRASQFSTIYQLKPVHTQGLSVKSDRGDMLRILFGLTDEGDIGILGIGEKNSIKPLMRKLGILTT